MPVTSIPAATLREPLVRLLPEEQVAKALGVSERHLRSLRSRRLIPFVRLGKAVRYVPADVTEAIKNLTVRTRFDIETGGE